jgi:hypothetical protein
LVVLLRWWILVPIGLLFVGVLGYWFYEARVRPCHHGKLRAWGRPVLCEACVQEERVRERDRTDQVDAHRLSEARRKQEIEALKVAWLEKARRLAFLQDLPPEEFQSFVWMVFRRLDYTIEETPFVQDGGVDGTLVRNGTRTVLQCKRYRGDVGEPAVRDLYGTYLHQKANGAILVTTGGVTRPARKFAEGKNIEFIDGRALLALLAKANVVADLVPDSFVLSKHHSNVMTKGLRSGARCPVCSGRMRSRRGRFGRFLGCSNYPNCRFTHSPRP